MMSDFFHTTIDEQLTLQRGYDITKKQQKPGGVPVVSSGGIASYHNESKVKGPGVVLGRKGTLGTVFFIDEDFWPHDTSLWVKNFKGNNSRFVYYFFKNITTTIKKMDVGAANPALNRNHVHPMEVIWPKREVQNNIVKVLSMLDDKIELNRQTNQTLEQIAQAIFKSWFVDFEPVKAKAQARASVAQGCLPGCDQNTPLPKNFDVEAAVERAAMCAISGKSLDELEQLSDETQQQLKTTTALFPDALVESELGEIPEGWEKMSLYETAEYINGSVFKAKDFSADRSGLPIVKIAELKQGIYSGTKFTNLDVKKKYFISNGDVLYSWSGSPETSLEVFKWFGGDGWLNQHIFKLNFTSSEKKYFTYYLLKYMKPLLVSTAKQKQTTGLGHVTVADMKRIKVPCPTDEILSEFGRAISSLYNKCSLLEKENITLVEIKDAFLPKLLSGEINLSRPKTKTTPC